MNTVCLQDFSDAADIQVCLRWECFYEAVLAVGWGCEVRMEMVVVDDDDDKEKTMESKRSSTWRLP